MSNETKLKIIMLGPVSSGKTTIANFLSDSTETIAAGECRPTKGVRIVEFVAQGLKGKTIYQNSVEVELWDCSGDNRYRSCWPAIQDKSDGILFVYSEASKEQKSDLDAFYNFFVEEAHFPKSCCLVVRNDIGNRDGEQNSRNPLHLLTHTVFNLEDSGVEFKKSFKSFLSSIMKVNSDN